jgi:hypothetical protein
VPVTDFVVVLFLTQFTEKPAGILDKSIPTLTLIGSWEVVGSVNICRFDS